MTNKFLLLGLNSVKNLDLLSKELEKSIDGLKIVKASDGLQFLQKTRKQQFTWMIAEENLAGVTNSELIIDLKKEKNNKDSKLLFLFHQEITPEMKKQFRNDQMTFFYGFPPQANLFVDLVKKFINNNLETENDKNVLEQKVEVSKDLKDFSVELNVISPFVKSTVLVLKELCQPHTIRHFSPYRRIPEEKLGVTISGILQIHSPLVSGRLGISFSDDSFKYVCEKMNLTFELGLGLENQDLAAEVSRKMVELLNKDLKKHSIEIPEDKVSILRGRDHFISFEEEDQTILIPIDIDHHRIYLQSVLKANKKNKNT